MAKAARTYDVSPAPPPSSFERWEEKLHIQPLKDSLNAILETTDRTNASSSDDPITPEMFAPPAPEVSPLTSDRSSARTFVSSSSEEGGHSQRQFTTDGIPPFASEGPTLRSSPQQQQFWRGTQPSPPPRCAEPIAGWAQCPNRGAAEVPQPPSSSSLQQQQQQQQQEPPPPPPPLPPLVQSPEELQHVRTSIHAAVSHLLHRKKDPSLRRFVAVVALPASEDGDDETDDTEEQLFESLTSQRFSVETQRLFKTGGIDLQLVFAESQVKEEEPAAAGIEEEGAVVFAESQVVKEEEPAAAGIEEEGAVEDDESGDFAFVYDTNEADIDNNNDDDDDDEFLAQSPLPRYHWEENDDDAATQFEEDATLAADSAATALDESSNEEEDAGNRHDTSPPSHFAAPPPPTREPPALPTAQTANDPMVDNDVVAALQTQLCVAIAASDAAITSLQRRADRAEAELRILKDDLLGVLGGVREKLEATASPRVSP